jgi:hypothetical protein
VIDIDLAEPAERLGAPPAHLLAPSSLLLVLLPLLLAAGAHQAWRDAIARADDVERGIAEVSERVAAAAAARRHSAQLQSMQNGVVLLHAAALATLELVPLVTAHLPPGVHLSELAIDGGAIRITGTAPSPGDISLWLARSAGRGESLVWEGPEVRHVASGSGHVDFSLRIRRATREARS